MMTRRELLAWSGAGALSARLGAAQGVGPGDGPSVRYRDYSRCLPDYLRAQADRAYRLRNAEIAKLTTEGAIRERQRWVTQTFWKLVGGMPERTPLNARTVGSFEREGYRLEKVVYESQPNFHVSANLYIPTTAQPPFPGVLVQMGHTTDGKASYQRSASGWRASAIWCWDSIPWARASEPTIPAARLSRSRLGADEEHTRPGRQMLLKGDTSTRLQTWDAVRSLDYLAAHPLVDPKRLGGTGQSGGGTNTMLLAAVDDRLAAAAVSCGIIENVACADFNPPGSTDDGEQNLIASGPAGFDRWDLLYPLAPKPLLILASDKDFFGTYSPNYISSGTEEFGKLKRIYETLGHTDRLAWFGTPLPHGLAYDMRVQIYNWFSRWLKGDTKTITEEPRQQSRIGIGDFCGAQRQRGAVLPQRDALLDEQKAGGSEEPRAPRSTALPGPASEGPRSHAFHRLLPQLQDRGPGVFRRARSLGSGLAVPGEAARQFKARGGAARTRGPHFVA